MNRGFVLTAASTLACTTLAPSTLAQTTEEIVVTAQKIEQNITDVPISVTVYSGETVRELGLNSVAQLARQTPSVTVGVATGEGGVPLIAIRGVSLQDYSDINESPSSVYMDEFYRAALFGVDTQVFDLARAEVLRGPQGTLFGRNATGGLIQLVTQAPTPAPQGYIQGGFGDWNQQRFEGALGGPIAGDLMGRLSGAYETFDGYSENLFPGPDGNYIDAFSLRGQLLYRPGPDTRASLLVQYSENDGENAFTNLAVTLDPTTGLAVENPGGADAAGYVDPTPDNRADINIDNPGYLETRQLTAIARLQHRFGGVNFVMVTGHEASDKDLYLDTDASPLFVRESQFTPEASEFSQEFRLEGAGDRFTWLAGLYYFDFDVDGTQDLNGASFVSASYTPMNYSVSTESWAAFGNISYDLTPTLTADLGLRYTEEEKDIAIFIPFTFVYDANGVSTGFGSFQFDQSTVGDLAHHQSENISFNTRLSWRTSDGVLIYGGVARGFKGGAFNLGLFALPLVSEYKVDEEKLTSYEAGVHADVLGGALRINASAFHYDYEDYQAFLYDSATRSSRIFNTDATINGVELEAITTPFEGLDLSASVTVLDAMLDDIADRMGNVRDREMALAPEISANFLARYTWNAPWGGDLSLQGDVVYAAKQYFDPLNSPALHEPDHVVVDGRLSWTDESERFRIAIVGKNIGDEEYRNYVFDFSSQLYVQGMYARPQWFGVTLEYSWQ